MKDFSSAVSRILQQTFAEFGNDRVQLRDVMEVAHPRVKALIESGELSIDIDGVIDAEMLAVDSAHGKLADRVLAQLANGLETLTIDEDPMLDVIVTLGKGLRKQWRHINSEDLILMDNLRYDNMRKQQDAYGAWRAVYSPVAAVLIRYDSLESAVAAGAFGSAQAA